MSPKSLNAHVKLPHSVIVKSTGLLHMFYTVREFAEEIAIPEHTLRDWLSHGAPHTRDSLSHIWIDRQAFAGCGGGDLVSFWMKWKTVIFKPRSRNWRRC
jgi:hypothetical protein